MKINFYGTLFGESGYDSHCRGLLAGLQKAGHEIKIDAWRPDNWEMLVNDWQLEAFNRKFMHDGVSIAITTPLYWPYYIASNPKHFIGFLVWEGDKIPLYWFKYILDERVDQIWVPSNHTRYSILNSFIKVCHKFSVKFEDINKKIKIVPHGHFPEHFYPEKKKDIMKNKMYNPDMFTFIANKGWAEALTDRGGMQFLFEAFSKEFSKKEPVRLLAKINTAYNNPNWKINEFMEQVPLNKKNKANIQVCIKQMNYNELRGLYNCGEAFVCTSMAEAFNLPGIEAMACGLPNVQTTFGGQTDYMNTKNSFYITEGEDYLVKNNILYEGIRWYKPKISNVRAVLREVYETLTDEKTFRKYKRYALITAKKFTWENTGKIATEFLKELEL